MLAAPASPEPYHIDVKLCYPFIDAVLTTLKVQCALSVTPGPPTFRDAKPTYKNDILILAPITTESTIASVAIVLGNEVFLGIMGRMMGETYSKITPELQDGAMELLNIIFNQAKKLLCDKGYAGVRSIPQIIFGNTNTLNYLTRGRIIVLPFESELGNFVIEITTQDLTVSDRV